MPQTRQSLTHRCLIPLCWLLAAGTAAATAGAAPGDRNSRIAAIKGVLGQFLHYSRQGALETPAARKLLTGEAAERWHTASFGQLAAAPDAVLLTGPTTGVARVQWFGENGQVTDFYFYLQRQGGWKLSAMRSLSLTGITEEAMLALRSKATRTPKEQAELANLELTLSCDRELRRHFRSRRPAFEQLRRLARPSSRSASALAARSKLIESLHLDRVDARGNGDVEFLIGGVTDNSVGYLYCPSDRPPAISPSEYIWVEKIAPRWYLYRTT